MQMIKKLGSFELAAIVSVALLMASFVGIPGVVQAQEDEDDQEQSTLAGEIADVFGVEQPDVNYNNTTTGTPATADTTTTTSSSPTTTGQPMDYTDVTNAEVIDDQDIVQNPGGVGNENINLEDDEITPPPTNIRDMVLPQDIQSKNIDDLNTALLVAGYSIADIKPAQDFNDGTTKIVVRGDENVMEQPDQMLLDSISRNIGYTVESHFIIDGAWQTIFEPLSVTPSP
jgi:hypothetical protein